MVERRYEPHTLLFVELLDRSSIALRSLLVRVVHVQLVAPGRWILGCTLVSRLDEAEIAALLAETTTLPVERAQPSEKGARKRLLGGPAQPSATDSPPAQEPPALHESLSRLLERIETTPAQVRLPSRRRFADWADTPAEGSERSSAGAGTDRSASKASRLPAAIPHLVTPVTPVATPARVPTAPSSPTLRQGDATPGKRPESTDRSARQSSSSRPRSTRIEQILARPSVPPAPQSRATETPPSVVTAEVGNAVEPALAPPAPPAPPDPPGRVGELLCLTGHRCAVNTVAFAADGQRAFSGSGGEIVDGLVTDGEDCTLRVWDLATGRGTGRFEESQSPVLCVAPTPNDTHVLAASRSGNLYYVDAHDFSIFRPMGRHRQTVFGLAFSPDGRHILSGCDDGVVRLWDLQGARLKRFTGHGGAVTSVAFSPDGRSALSGSLDGTVCLWDVAGGTMVRQFKGHTRGVLAVAFAPNGKLALSGSGDATLRLWDVSDGRASACWQGHTQAVTSVAFTPDGRRALSGSSDQTVRLWDVATGTEICSFTGHTGPVKSVAVSPGGCRALSGGADRTLRLWGLPDERNPSGRPASAAVSEPEKKPTACSAPHSDARSG